LFVGKKLNHQLLLVGAYTPFPALHLSGLSSLNCLRVATLLPGTVGIIAKLGNFYKN